MRGLLRAVLQRGKYRHRHSAVAALQLDGQVVWNLRLDIPLLLRRVILRFALAEKRGDCAGDIPRALFLFDLAETLADRGAVKFGDHLPRILVVSVGEAVFWASELMYLIH